MREECTDGDETGLHPNAEESHIELHRVDQGKVETPQEIDATHAVAKSDKMVGQFRSRLGPIGFILLGSLGELVRTTIVQVCKGRS